MMKEGDLTLFIEQFCTRCVVEYNVLEQLRQKSEKEEFKVETYL